jgi:hypothetical protein
VARYSVGNEVARSTVANGDSLFLLWNPHATIAIRVVHISFILSSANTGGRQLTLNRASTAGATPTGTYTADIDSHYRNRAAPPSGTLLYQILGTQPTVGTPPLLDMQVGAVAGSLAGFDIRTPIVVPAGTGLSIEAVTITAGGSATFTWDE